MQKLLIVDDTQTNIEILRGILHHDYKIYSANCGADALQIANREAPDLILLDVMMPEMDGYEVCQELKRSAKTKDVPVIFVSAMSTEADQAKGLECGAIDYMLKPVSTPIVKARVRNHLELKRSRDLLQQLAAELSRKNQDLQKLAIEDGLTRLANRRHFNEVLEMEVRRACHTGQCLSLILCDVDFFKRYNDAYGHLAGDRCLKVVANTMRTVFRRAGDLVARFGGEEFAVILADTPPHAASLLAEKLREEMMRIHVPHQTSQVADCVTISLGVVGAPVTRSSTVSWFIEAADRALYVSKQAGRNRVSVWPCGAEDFVDRGCEIN
ncbi:diguanylate cyclase [Geomonas sp. RF6]|uniref:diguanylate cyclase domain-containing protein n=1 Tax=Geomonas sp. RF6 TaxID=2897342 RepID=UPI001E2CEBC7|nr:diguanylate cyclase [Geomonas sp. RF6]UFS70142.1 diguanylate cyclase [Geomonas sp. RF6]